ncbi:MAG: cobalamin biosynthesis protein CobQ [Oscillospiraceae bacterium]
MEYRFRKATIVCGHYGCGKTNLSINLGLRLSEKGRVTVVDLDTVNPYFRAADHAALLERRGARVICPQYANTNLDIPVLNIDLESIIAESDYTIIDVGGSDSGAFPLGCYGELFRKLTNELEVLYVFNMYRSPDRSAVQTAEYLREIEAASRLKCTGLVNNSNLGAQTTPQTVAKSADFAREVSRLCGLPVVFTCVTENETESEAALPVKRLVKLPWEEM